MEVNEENEYYFYGSGGLSTVKSNGISHHFSRLGGQLLGSSDGFFILQDVRGDVVALVSNGIAGEANGKIVAAYTYDAFGSTRSIQEIENITSPFRFAGGLYDSSSGNYIFGVRMYAPDQGRWLSKDAYLGSAEDPLSLHRYVYCQNDPVNFVDPSGYLGNSLSYIVFYSAGTTMLTYADKRDNLLSSFTSYVTISSAKQSYEMQKLIDDGNYSNAYKNEAFTLATTFIDPISLLGVIDIDFDSGAVDPFGNYLNIEVGYEVMMITRNYEGLTNIWTETEYFVYNEDGELVYHNCSFVICPNS